MKKLIIIACGILFATSASASLWSYYTSRGEQLPPISERAIIAETCGISDYSGTYDQNIALEKCLLGEQQLGIAIPNVAALFETSLQNSVASDATTMTLVSATLKNGNTLSGLYGFIIDEGSANEEFVICTASSTALSACLRGVDPVDGKTEVSALKYSHRRGASIKITDYPILGIMRRVLNGDEGLPNFIYYDASTTLPTLNGQLATKYYVDNVGAGGFTSANVSTTRGLSVDGSSPEKVGVNVSSTQGMAFDTSGALYQKVSSTQGLQTDSNGIGINYAHDNTWTGTNTFSGTTTLASPVIGFINTRFGTGASGNATLTAPTTLTADTHYTNLTINSGVVLNTGGYRLFVSGTLTNNGTISRNGNAGANGQNGGGNSANAAGGAALASGTLFGSLAGGQGGSSEGSGSVGQAAGVATSSFQVATSSAGGNGGNGSGTELGGTFATNIIDYPLMVNSLDIGTENYIYYTPIIRGDFTGLKLANFSSSGGGAAAELLSTVRQGHGGGAGSGGGIIYIAANNLVNNGTISATGGNGGAGGTGATRSGGGGGGGHGGLIVLVYKSLTEGTITVAGGSGGLAPGTPAGYGGTNGDDGKTGSIIKIKL